MGSLREDFEKEYGPAPVAPPDLRFLGWRLNGGDVDQYRREDAGYRKAYDIYIDQRMNPLRDASLERISQISGHPMDQIAEPSQYRSVPGEMPSSERVNALQYTSEGQRPFRTEMRPETVSLPGPGAPQHTPTGEVSTMMINRGLAEPGGGTMRQYAERGPSMFEEGPRPQATMLKAHPIELQGPGNPVGPQQYERQAAPVPTMNREVDPQAKSTLAQQMLGMSGIKRDATWPRQYSQPGASKMMEMQGLMQARNPLTGQQYTYDEAARIIFGKEYIPGGARERNLNARTDTSAARADNLDADTAVKDINAENLPRKYNDAHDESVLRQRRIENLIAVNDKITPIRAELLRAQQALAAARQNDSSNRYALDVQKFELAKTKLDYLMKLAYNLKGEANDETKAMIEEELANIIGYTGEVKQQPWYQSMFGPTPQVQHGPSKVQSIGTPGAPQPQAQPTPYPQSPDFPGAPAGKNLGDVLNDKAGKPIAKWDGKQWQRLTQ